MNIKNLPTSREEVAQIVISVIANTYGVGVDEVIEETNFRGDLGMDSLDVIEVVLNIEKEFNIDIEDADIDKINTVEQMINHLHNSFETMRKELQTVSNGQQSKS